MKFQKRAVGLGLLASCLLCAPAAAEIRIAVAGPMEGQFGAFGEQMLAGAAQAVADINSAGGVNGEDVILDAVDDGCEADKAVAVANQLIGKGVVFVAGHFCFGASMSASDVYAEAGIVQITPATTLPKFTDERAGQGVFRLAPRDDQQAEVAAGLLAGEFSGERIALLHDKTAYGKGLVDAVKSAMNAVGVSESLSLGFDAGEDDYRGLVSQLSLQDIGVVYLGGYHPEAGLIRLEMERQGLDAKLISGDALMTEEFWSVAGPAGEGTLLTYPEIPRRMEAAQKVVSALEEAGLPAERYALTTYAAIQAWAQAAGKAGGTSLGTVSRELEAGVFDTVLGTVSFNEKGDAGVPAYVWYEWRDGVAERR